MSKIVLVNSREDEADFENWVKGAQPPIAIDTETTGLDWKKESLRTVQFSDGEIAYVIPAIPEQYLRIRWALGFFPLLVFQKWGFDAHFIEEAYGSVLEGKLIHCTKTMAHLIDPSLQTGLKYRAELELGAGTSAFEKNLQDVMKENEWDWPTIPVETPEYWQYAAVDAILTRRLYDTWVDQMNSVYVYEMECQAALYEMERVGMRIDVDYVKKLDMALEDHIDRLRDWAQEKYGIRLNSRNELENKLLDLGWKPSQFTPTGKPSLAREEVQKIDIPLAQGYLELKKSEKLRSAFTSNLLKHHVKGRIHAEIDSLGTRTGRMSMRNPNLQQMPRTKMIRDAFPASEGHRLVLADYDSMELRMLAQHCEDKNLIQACKSGDIHRETAKLLWPGAKVTDRLRQIAKTVNYATIYGAGAMKLSQILGISPVEASDVLNQYRLVFPDIWTYSQDLSKSRFTTTRDGRRLVADEGKEYNLLNYTIQGTCADLLKRKIVEIFHSDIGKYLRIPVHDELVLEAPKREAKAVAQRVREMMSDHEYDPPLTVGSTIVQRWGEKYG